MKNVISKRRKDLGLTQHQLAEKLNVSDKVISKWETGRSLPDTSLLLPLAETLQITLDELMGGDDTADEIDKAAEYEVNAAYKNSCIIAMALQVAAAALIIIGAVLLSKFGYYYSSNYDIVAYVMISLGVLCEIAAIAVYLVKRNILLDKYPARTDCDKKYIDIMLYCTYPLVLAVIVALVIPSGFRSVEQLFVILIFAAIALVPFIVLFILNRKLRH